jgi:hypothetical protein
VQQSTTTLWHPRYALGTDNEPEAENEPFCDNACSRTSWTSEAPTRDND